MRGGRQSSYTMKKLIIFTLPPPVFLPGLKQITNLVYGACKPIDLRLEADYYDNYADDLANIKLF